MKSAALTTFSLIPIFIGALWLWEYFSAGQVGATGTTYNYEIQLSWAVLIILTTGFLIPGKLLKLLMFCIFSSALITGVMIFGFVLFGSGIQ